jgi:hypothetical protein
MASDFILSHKLLEYLWWVHFSWSKYISNKDNEKIFFPINLLVLPWYLNLYLWKSEAYEIIRKKLKANKDYQYIEWYFQWDTLEYLKEFVSYYYWEYLFSVEEEVYESETVNITELEQVKISIGHKVPLKSSKYISIRGRYIPTIESLKIFLRKLYDNWGIKMVQDYLNQPYYDSDNPDILGFIDQHFHFNNKRGYGWKIESKYQSLSLYGDGTLVINKPYIWYSRISISKDPKLFLLLKDLLKSYPSWVKVSEKYSTVFGFSRTNKTPYHEKIRLWKMRKEIKILWEKYSPQTWLFQIQNNTISLLELKIPE